ncbi:MAG: hypothetical protein Ct9H300mP7_5500 [Verrucomicrobiota bacterium]|nr:MAG: hypothetical protein Ct9H300mP7_5500 [Verrucomicrobiota bacterium]
MAELTDQTFAVTGVPDEKKGERLVVLYQNLDESAVDSVIEKLTICDLPNIWKPRGISFSKSRRCRTSDRQAGLEAGQDPWPPSYRRKAPVLGQGKNRQNRACTGSQWA